jgi:hypothetical protein
LVAVAGARLGTATAGQGAERYKDFMLKNKGRKRPCCFCLRWFFPDPRVSDRQRACSSADCQCKRRKAQQAAWHKRNPDYFTARRIQQKSLKKRPATPVLRSPLDRLPWDMAQTQFGVQGAEFLGFFGRLLSKCAQTQRGPQVIDTS